MSANLSVLRPERRVIAAHGPRGAFFWERSRARRRGWPERCFRGAAGAICVAILAFALPGGEALKYTDAGARANHAADGATEGGDGSDESDNPHAGKDLAVKREAIKSVLRATCMLSRGIRFCARVRRGAYPTHLSASQNTPACIESGQTRKSSLPTDPSRPIPTNPGRDTPRRTRLSPRKDPPPSRVGRPRQPLLLRKSAAHRPFGPGKGLPRAPQGCPSPTGVLKPPPRHRPSASHKQQTQHHTTQHDHAPRHERQARHAALEAHGQEAPGHEDAG